MALMSDDDEFIIIFLIFNKPVYFFLFWELLFSTMCTYLFNNESVCGSFIFFVVFQYFLEGSTT